MNRAFHRIATMCRVLEVSPSGYYAWRTRSRSQRERADEALCKRINAIHDWSEGTYGAPRIHAELRSEGWCVGRKRVARLMQAFGLRGVKRRTFMATTDSDKRARPAPDRVERDFTATAPDELWVSDISFIRTWEGFVFLAVVLDVFTRRVVGWSIARHMRKELPLSALEMALQHRRPERVIHHSDQGCQYTSAAFQGRCAAANVTVSMGSVGDCFDNAMAESFFATLECELLRRKALRSRDEAEQELFRFIEGWYNPRRRHSALGYRAPMEFEAEYWEQVSNPEPVH